MYGAQTLVEPTGKPSRDRHRAARACSPTCSIVAENPLQNFKVLYGTGCVPAERQDGQGRARRRRQVHDQGRHRLRREAARSRTSRAWSRSRGGGGRWRGWGGDQGPGDLGTWGLLTIESSCRRPKIPSPALRAPRDTNILELSIEMRLYSRGGAESAEGWEAVGGAGNVRVIRGFRHYGLPITGASRKSRSFGDPRTRDYAGIPPPLPTGHRAPITDA